MLRLRARTARAERLIWVFGSPIGSGRLSSLVAELTGRTVWDEPLIGALFGHFYYRRSGHRIDRRGKHFIMRRAYARAWLEPMRDLVLSGAAVRFPDVARSDYLVIREPNGSIGAPLLMEALPESRMILLVGDPLEIVASSLNDHGEAGEAPDELVRRRAEALLQQLAGAKRAHDSHRGPKALVRYEELRADTLTTMRRLCAALEIDVEETELVRAVSRHAREEVPGGSALSAEQARLVEEVTAPLLEGPEPSRAAV